MDIKGKLYTSFRTYTDIPRDEEGKPAFGEIISYTDTADTGADDLVSIVAGVYEGEGYILDVLMTDAPMEQTEPKTAEQLASNHVATAGSRATTAAGALPGTWSGCCGRSTRPGA